ncbi:MAG: hypothetical protein FJW30_08395 [Acidobacteria bacterium]|nr:hypothetical protein [Acidobacteriota bacterium]
MQAIRIAGGGLAGSAAALAVRQAGRQAWVWDPAPLPRHKVCGEFLTPEIEGVLQSAGLWDRFAALQPARMSRMDLIFDGRRRSSRFPVPAYGLSRFNLDRLLYDSAKDAGAEYRRERAPDTVDILAHGRQASGPRGGRTFGFKAHFEGPVSEAVELYFSSGFYAGVNPVEGGVTNVCGLASEAVLASVNFNFDELLDRHSPLRERLAPMRRVMDWLTTGPLVYELHAATSVLRAGDALQFVDPFTGTGMTIAIWSGLEAGRVAAAGGDAAGYYQSVRRRLDGQFHWCRRLRLALEHPVFRRLAPVIPPVLLYRLTRPKIENR